MDWNQLIESPILDKIKKDWISLLENKKLKERDYHEFLKHYPALFFNSYLDSYLTISKVKLGYQNMKLILLSSEKDIAMERFMS